MTSLPMTWEPLGMDGLFPRLDADIEVGPLGTDRTQLAISGRLTRRLDDSTMRS